MTHPSRYIIVTDAPGYPQRRTFRNFDDACDYAQYCERNSVGPERDRRSMRMYDLKWNLLLTFYVGAPSISLTRTIEGTIHA